MSKYPLKLEISTILVQKLKSIYLTGPQSVIKSLIKLFFTKSIVLPKIPLNIYNQIFKTILF